MTDAQLSWKIHCQRIYKKMIESSIKHEINILGKPRSEGPIRLGNKQYSWVVCQKYLFWINLAARSYPIG